MATPRKADKTPNFETAIKKLEEIVRKLEEEEIPLDSSLKLFEEGQTLVRACEVRLREAENRISKLMENSAGDIVEAPLEADAERGDEADDEDETDATDNAANDTPTAASPKNDGDPDNLPF